MSASSLRIDDMHLRDRWNTLTALLRGQGPWTLAYSGGLDSRFLAHAGWLADCPPLLVHVRGPHVPTGESHLGLSWAAEQGLEVRVMEVDPLSVPLVAAGDPQRCYACKRMLFERIAGVARGRVCDGSNVSDAGEYRPGRRALRELGIRSPLEEAGLDKSDIRTLAGQTGLTRPDQPARACLLTRLPYGERPTHAVLALLNRGEDLVEQMLAEFGLPGTPFRLRKIGEKGFALHLETQCEDRDVCAGLAAGLQEIDICCTEIRCMNTLSGFFDREDGLHK